MGFRSAVVPTRLATSEDLVLSDTRDYAPGANANFEVDPSLFGGFDPLRIELIAAPTFAWLRAQIRLFPPQPTGSGVDATSYRVLDNVASLIPVQPLGGKLEIDTENIDSFGGDMTVRVYRLRGLHEFSALVRSCLSSGATSSNPNIDPGTPERVVSIDGTPVIANRARGVVVVDEQYDVFLRWRVDFFGLTSWDQPIASGVAANTPTFFDEPWQGESRCEVWVENVSANPNASATASGVAAPLI